MRTIRAGLAPLAQSADDMLSTLLVESSKTMSSSKWYGQIETVQRRSLIAASLGWMLDSMDVQLYALILLDVMESLDMDTGTGGLLASLTLLASAVGGVLFVVLADLLGRGGG